MCYTNGADVGFAQSFRVVSGRQYRIEMRFRISAGSFSVSKAGAVDADCNVCVCPTDGEGLEDITVTTSPQTYEYEITAKGSVVCASFFGTTSAWPEETGKLSHLA